MYILSRASIPHYLVNSQMYAETVMRVYSEVLFKDCSTKILLNTIAKLKKLLIKIATKIDLTNLYKAFQLYYQIWLNKH